MTYDGSALRIYMDGTQVGAVATGGPILTNDVPLIIGARDSFGVVTQHFQGDIDEVGLYDRALSQSEIQAIFDAGAVGRCKAGAFTDFTLTKLRVDLNDPGEGDDLELRGEFVLGLDSDGIDILTEDSLVQAGPFELEIPAGSFTGDKGKFKFETELVEMELKGSAPYEFRLKAEGVDLSGASNAMRVIVVVGDDHGVLDVALEGKLDLVK